MMMIIISDCDQLVVDGTIHAATTVALGGNYHGNEDIITDAVDAAEWMDGWFDFLPSVFSNYKNASSNDRS